MARLNGRPAFYCLSLCTLIVVTSLTGCDTGAKSTVTSPSATPAPSTTPAPVSSASSSCATGSLHLLGSTAFMPIAQEAAGAYTHNCPGATIVVTGGDSDYGLTQLQDAVNSGSPTAGSMIAMYDGLPSGTTGLSPYPMGVLILSLVTHTGLYPAGNVTTVELRTIFAKPGEQGKVAVGRRAGSGTRRAFVTNIPGFNPGAPDKGNCPPPTGKAVSFTNCTEDNTPDLLNFVNETPNAIGYAVMSRPRASYPQVTVLNVDNVAPTPDNVRNGSYKFWAVENLFAATQPTALAKDFLDFLSHYREPNLPSDFIPCYAAPKSLGTGC